MIKTKTSSNITICEASSLIYINNNIIITEYIIKTKH